jgi:hypothetical protein
MQDIVGVAMRNDISSCPRKSAKRVFALQVATIHALPSFGEKQKT